jgi:hypothetical protein
MTISLILVMLVLMTASLHLPVYDSICDPSDVVLMTAFLHLPVNDGIHDPSDVGPDDGIPSLACE